MISSTTLGSKFRRSFRHLLFPLDEKLDQSSFKLVPENLSKGTAEAEVLEFLTNVSRKNFESSGIDRPSIFAGAPELPMLPRTNTLRLKRVRILVNSTPY
jgi:hypothetical protein